MKLLIVENIFKHFQYYTIKKLTELNNFQLTTRSIHIKTTLELTEELQITTNQCITLPNRHILSNLNKNNNNDDDEDVDGELIMREKRKCHSFQQDVVGGRKKREEKNPSLKNIIMAFKALVTLSANTLNQLFLIYIYIFS